VFLQSPWFGSPDFMDQPIMQALVQGEGIIDVVNTYIGILLSGGAVGLVIFLGMFMPAIWALLKKMLRGRDQHTRMAFACLIVVLVLISTVSYVNSIPYLCLLCAGLGISVAAQREPAVR
jgi:O-antigen ligase